MDAPHTNYANQVANLSRAGVPVQNYFRIHAALYSNVETLQRAEAEVMKLVKEIEPKLKRIREVGAQLKQLGSAAQTQINDQRRSFETFKRDCRENRWKLTENDWNSFNTALNQLDVYTRVEQKTYSAFL